MEAATASQATPTARKQSPTLMPDRFGLAEVKRREFVADVEIGVSVEDILDPSYWAHTAEQMGPFDHIEARAEDGKWIAYLIVLVAQRGYAKVILDRVLEIKENSEVPVASLKHSVEWKGPHHKFAVIRKADSQMLHSMCKTREEADLWLRNYEKTLN